MENENKVLDATLFDNVLEKNEQVLKVIKPNKFKLIFYWMINAFWINLWIAIIGILPIVSTDLENNTHTPWG